MLVQVVHCHPLTDSYNHALFRIIVATLEASGHQVIASDLYREGFDPVLTPAERASYRAPRYDGGGVTAYTDILRRIDGIIFCFPQWWFSLPAMLKGYFDRVWAPGVAFAHDQDGGRIQPLLSHIKLFGVVTSYGSPWWIARFYAGDPVRKVLLRALKPLCGSGTRSFYLALYDIERTDAAARDRFAARVRRRIAEV